MFTPKSLHVQLTELFQHKPFFSRDELFIFYKQYDAELNEGTFGWRIHDLKKKHIIKDVRKGIYTLEHKQFFSPHLDNTIKKIAFFLSSIDPPTNYNIWSTAWLNEFIELQATSFIYVLEVEKDSMSSVFHKLKDAKKHINVFLKPDEKVIENYISETSQSIVIEPKLTRAPVSKKDHLVIPTLEKILVDLFCDEKLFFAYQGKQLVKIYESCLEKYFINFSRLFNYAKRRNREEAIKGFLTAHDRLYDKVKQLI